MREEARIFSETGPILGESGETMARYKAHGERFAIEQAGRMCRLSAKCCWIGPKSERIYKGVLAKST